MIPGVPHICHQWKQIAATHNKRSERTFKTCLPSSGNFPSEVFHPDIFFADQLLWRSYRKIRTSQKMCRRSELCQNNQKNKAILTKTIKEIKSATLRVISKGEGTSDGEVSRKY